MSNIPPHEPASQEQWEYYVARFSNLPDLRDAMNMRGREGWEAVNVAANAVVSSVTGTYAPGASTEWTVLMKRRLP